MDRVSPDGSKGPVDPGFGMPPADFDFDADLVAGLLEDQHPDLAPLPLSEIAAGWDNRIFRLGDHLAVRLPRRAAAADLIAKEQVWLPRLAPALPVPVPFPLREGAPGRGYPCRWSVTPFLPGAPVNADGLPSHLAPGFADFLRSLHRPAPLDAPVNPFRGVPLAQRADSVESRLESVAKLGSSVSALIRGLWSGALAALPDHATTWIHGDLHPGNVLIDRKGISGILDWGDLARGDAATDLGALWMLFEEPSARRAALDAYGPVSGATLARARGWAVFYGATLFAAGHERDTQHRVVGERTLRRLASEAATF